mmetsp:Transcript_61132/g.161998  ORF Transcript_61132/g.161998 Transcript_61132/m.161998 type:complete len:462 (+) Transcript_61132:151-1536(+)
MRPKMGVAPSAHDAVFPMSQSRAPRIFSGSEHRARGARQRGRGTRGACTRHWSLLRLVAQAQLQRPPARAQRDVSIDAAHELAELFDGRATRSARALVDAHAPQHARVRLLVDRLALSPLVQLLEEALAASIGRAGAALVPQPQQLLQHRDAVLRLVLTRAERAGRRGQLSRHLLGDHTLQPPAHGGRACQQRVDLLARPPHVAAAGRHDDGGRRDAALHERELSHHHVARRLHLGGARHGQDDLDIAVQHQHQLAVVRAALDHLVALGRLLPVREPHELLEVVRAQKVGKERLVDGLLLGRQPHDALGHQHGDVHAVHRHVEHVPPDGQPEDLADRVESVEDYGKRARRHGEHAQREHVRDEKRGAREGERRVAGPLGSRAQVGERGLHRPQQARAGAAAAAAASAGGGVRRLAERSSRDGSSGPRDSRANVQARGANELAGGVTGQWPQRPQHWQNTRR